MISKIYLKVDDSALCIFHDRTAQVTTASRKLIRYDTIQEFNVDSKAEYLA